MAETKGFTIRHKVMALIVFLLGVAVLVSVIVLFTFSKINESMSNMERIDSVQHSAYKGQLAMLKAREYESEFFTRKDDKWSARVEKQVELVNKSLDDIDKATTDQKIKEHSKKARSLGKQYVDQFKSLVETAKSGGDVLEGREELRDVINDFQPLLEDYIPKIVATQYKAANSDLDNTMSMARIVMLAVLIGASIGQAAMLLFIVLPVLKSISAMSERLKDIATGDGDLTKRIYVRNNDEIGETAHWFNVFVDKLVSVISQVAVSASQVANAAEKVQQNSAELMQSSENVAAQAASVSVASEQMSATAFEIASSCTMSAESASEADKATETGSQVIQETIAGMERISLRVGEAAENVETLGAKSSQIGDIVKTIEDIADQTNMLALNAAIEAARAGEMGRGFAVVADEVRALSERTTRATKEIGSVIKMIQQETSNAVHSMENGVREVEAGTREAGRSAEALSRITGGIQVLTQQMGQIAVAAEEQSATTNNISQCIRKITDDVQVSSSKAAESTESASEMARLAEEMQQQMAKFKI